MDARLTYRTPDAETLAQYARAHHVDTAAPIQASAQITIRAPIEHVWALLTDVANWAETLEPAVSKIELPTGVQTGANFKRTLNGLPIAARFEVVDPPHEIAWTGSTLGIRVVHRFVLTEQPDGSTVVSAEESMGGRPLAITYSSTKLQAAMDDSLTHLKQAAER